jgi:hypothetical protein
VDLSDVRVAVSVLSDTGDRVYYVSYPPESSANDFDKSTLAFVAISASKTRWWVSGYEERAKNIVLFTNPENGRHVSELKDGELKLADYFAARGRDYNSFVVIPIPTRPADAGRRAGLHISFKDKDSLRSVWNVVPEAPDANVYANASDLIEATPPELARVLQQGIGVIESLLRHFNEDVFTNALHSRRRS